MTPADGLPQRVSVRCRDAAEWTAAARATLALLLSILVLGVVSAAGGRADAHTPHDVISDVIASPSYADDSKVYVISGNHLLVSTDDAYAWKPLVNGLPSMPQEGKTLAQLAISASEPQVMYVSSTVGGVFRSADGGSSWHRATGGLARGDITPIAVAPRSADVVIAGGTFGGLFRTADGGAHWKEVPDFGRVQAVVFVPETGRAVAGDAGGRLSISDDDGSSWTEVARASGGAITALATSTGAAGATVFAGTIEGALLRSDDGAGSFATIGRGLPNEPINSIALSPTYSDDQTLWASASSKGVYRSTDGGETWVRTAKGLTTDPQAELLNNRDFRTVAVAPLANGGRVLFEAGFDGLFRSDSDGRRWRGVETLVDFVVGLDVSPRFQRDHAVAVATYVKGAYLSTDGGNRWEMIDKGLAELTPANEFAPVRRLHNVVFSPDYANDQTLFSATWTRFLRSTNGGRSWSTIEVGPPPAQPLLRQFIICVSQDIAHDRTIFLGTRQGDIFRSKRAGESGSWALVGNVGSRVRSLVLDAVAPGGSVLYAGTVNGVVTSNDGGTTWVRTGPSGMAQLAMSPSYASDGTVFAGTEAGLFVTRDKGVTWSALTNSLLSSSSWIDAVAVSPAYSHDQTLLVSVGGEGLYRSTDGGASFVEVGPDLIASNHVIGDFSNPSGTPMQFSPSFAHDQTIFGYAGHDVVRSTDAGNSWKVLRLPSAVAFRRTVDAGDLEISGAPDGSRRRTVVLVALASVLVLALLLGGGYVYARRRATGADGTA